MDLVIRRPTCRCEKTGRTIAAGETFYSAVVRADGAMRRIDYGQDAWSGPPEKAIAWWRSTMPENDAKGPSLASPDVLLDMLERLDGVEGEESLRYLLAVFLLRRRVLRVVEQRGSEEADPASLRLTCPRRAVEYLVRTAGGPNDEAIANKLSSLLWSGEAA